MSIPQLSIPFAYEAKIPSPVDLKTLFESTVAMNAYEKAFLYQGWFGFNKDGVYHEGQQIGNLYYMDTPTTFKGINADRVDGYHFYGAFDFTLDAGDDTTNIVDYINKIYSIANTAASGLNWKSSVTTASALPMTGNTNNDVRITQDTSDTYKWVDTAWVAIDVTFVPMATHDVAGKLSTSHFDLLTDLSNNSNKYINVGGLRQLSVLNEAGSIVTGSPIKASVENPYYYDLTLQLGLGLRKTIFDNLLLISVLDYDKIIMNNVNAVLATYDESGVKLTDGSKGWVTYGKGFTLDVNNILSVDGNIGQGGSSYLTIPAGFTNITNPLGDFNNSKYTNIQQYNDLDKRLTLDEVLQKILFPGSQVPSFVVPNIALSTSIANSYIEKGTSLNVTLSSVYSSIVGGINNVAEALQVNNTTLYYVNDTALNTNPQNIVFDSNKVFKVKTQYIANNNYIINLPDGSSKNASQLTGYPSIDVNRWIENTKSFNAVDPYYYGSIVDVVDINTITINALINKLASSKTINGKPSTLSVNAVITSGAVDPKKFIVVLSPYQINSCKYVQLANTEYWTTGSTNVVKERILTYTRVDNTVVTYYLYYSNNSYNDPNKLVTYLYTFI